MNSSPGSVARNGLSPPRQPGRVANVVGLSTWAKRRYAAAMARGNGWTWFLFLALGFLWGSSYFWIKVGVETLPPLTLIAGRLLLGGTFLAIVVAIARQQLPGEARMYGHLLVMSVVNIVLPFILITVGEQTIDSALASILNATVPLFVIVLAPMFLPDERITLPRVIGLALGFAGVILLVAPDLVDLSDADVTGELMMLGSSLCYAVGNVYAKRNVHGLRPMIPALFQVTFAAAIVTLLALIVDRPFERVTLTPEAIVAVIWLGILGSGFAYLCYFTILQRWGATRTSMVAYLLPVVGILMGTLIGEPITVLRVGGTALIIAGIALVNSGPRLRRLLDRRAGEGARAEAA
jgi:drug/metabolite transporter (DMT)-like permease